MCSVGDCSEAGTPTHLAADERAALSARAARRASAASCALAALTPETSISFNMRSMTYAGITGVLLSDSFFIASCYLHSVAAIGHAHRQAM